MGPLYQIDILDKNQDYVATVRNTPELDKTGTFLSYTTRLSNIGKCKFRIGKLDPLLQTEGDFLQPFQNHVRIRRAGTTVWQGVIVKNPQRNKRFIEVEAYTYLYLLSRVLIRHDPSDGHGSENYRILNNGTMAIYIQTFLDECKVDMGLPLANLTYGTIDNPNFPADYRDDTGAALTGSWTFSPNFTVKYDYRDLLYVLTTLAMYCNFDFEITPAMQFNFKQYIGNKQSGMKFTYGEHGNIDDYNAPLDGDAMANYLWGIAADNQSLIIHAGPISDEASVAKYGRIAALAAYGDVKNVNLLTSRIRGEITQVKTPDPEIHFFTNNKAYPLGRYAIGDTVAVQIKDGPNNVDTLRRIVGIDVQVNLTGDENIRVITNKPREDQ